MSKGTVPATTSQAIKMIADDLNLDPQVVELVIDAYTKAIRTALAKEIPFAMRGMGKFSHRYSAGSIKRKSNSEYYNDKVCKQVSFTLTDDARAELTGWVHDLGIKNNKRDEMLRMRMQPQEIEKIRRRKTLEDQRTLGFRSDVLFDEIPQSEQTIENQLGQSPTVEEITRRIGINLDE